MSTCLGVEHVTHLVRASSLSFRACSTMSSLVKPAASSCSRSLSACRACTLSCCCCIYSGDTVSSRLPHPAVERVKLAALSCSTESQAGCLILQYRESSRLPHPAVETDLKFSLLASQPQRQNFKSILVSIFLDVRSKHSSSPTNLATCRTQRTHPGSACWDQPAQVQP